MATTTIIFPSFEYCAAKYLDLWIRKEELMHTRLQSVQPSAGSVRAALALFKVSRGFSEIEKSKQQKTVAKLLREYGGAVSRKTVVARVTELANAFQKPFGMTNISAASKLLWLRLRDPVVLFDSRAVKALRHFGHDLNSQDYSSYYTAWQTQFSCDRKAVRSAALKLPGHYRFTAAAHLGRGYVEQICAQDWFVERVYDQYLWQVGAPRKKDGAEGALE